MSERARDVRALRVLLLAPTAKDAALTVSVLEEAGMECVACESVAHVRRELEAGGSVVMLPEEAVVPERDEPLLEWLRRQPPWSDLPVLVLARPGADSAAVAQAMDLLGNVTVLERPMRVAALVSAVRTALRARQRQHQLRDHLDELERAHQALRDSDRRKDEFLAILAHELRNPLAPIRNALQILQLTQPDDAAAERVAKIMNRQVNLMVRLVDDLLEVSRITSGKIELRIGPVDVSAVVHSAIETSRPLIEAGGHDLVLEIPGTPLTLDGDFVRLTQVVANLLNNAAKYSNPGGEIRVCVGRDADGVTISVQDNGKGIPSEMLPRVFELFVQLDRDSRWAQGGLGIGLTLAKTLVELHGGTLEARSRGIGHGSEFIVRMPPGSARAAPRVAAEDSGAPAALAAQRILVVDDNRDAAESLSTLLTLLGANVQVAFSGPEALDAFETYRPRVVLLDIGMPGMDGHEVARRIRLLPGSDDVTLIALTGWGQAEDRHRSQCSGFDHHIVKPADIHALQSLLVSLDA